MVAVPIVSRTLHFMSENTHPEIGIQDVATHVHTGRRTLEGRFRDVLGCSLRQDFIRMTSMRSTIRIFFLSLVLMLIHGLTGQEEVKGETNPNPPLELTYGIDIQPEKSLAKITLTVRGHGDQQIRRFESKGMREKVKIRFAKGAGGAAVFRYDFPIRQSGFKDSFKPVVNQDFFAGFCNSIFLLPKVEGKEFTSFGLNVTAPDGWKVVTSRGIGAKWKLDGIQDLMGTLICAGDYATYQFDLGHRGSDSSTRFYVAIQGERSWDDKAFVEEFKRMARGQMDYFGGSHPAPIQFLALHLLPKGQDPGVPGFNRRVPGHDTVLALHTPQRPRDHFEFLGMLAHEHLHNWYPNAMRSDLGPWFMEGLNDYVAYRGLLASGLHSRKQFSGMLSKWHREYEWCIRTKNARVMPYRRGMIAAWVLDIELRRTTNGKHGLTDVLLDLLDNKPLEGIVQRSHFLARLRKFSGEDMEPLYKRLVEDSVTIDLAPFLAGTGFSIDGKRNILINPESELEKKLFDAILSE